MLVADLGKLAKGLKGNCHLALLPFFPFTHFMKISETNKEMIKMKKIIFSGISHLFRGQAMNGGLEEWKDGGPLLPSLRQAQGRLFHPSNLPVLSFHVCQVLPQTMWEILIFSTAIICLVFGMAFFSLASNDDKPDYKLVFENDEILSFHITVAPEDWLKMWDRPFPYVKCAVRFGDEVYEDVGIRFKGNSSSRVRGLKKSYKFKFDKFDKKQRFHGFKKLNFQNGFRDPSLLREKLAYDLFGEASVPAPKATFAKLYLTIDGHYDDEYIGLYTLVEQVDKVF
ncbi:MAG: CotH kinase family protein, partial [Candidatus Poribacteria bacterium]